MQTSPQGTAASRALILSRVADLRTARKLELPRAFGARQLAAIN
jgi:hypothetical protein